MRVFITGMDGYLGWPLARYLKVAGHEVVGCDNYTRRHNADSLIKLERDMPIHHLDVRDYYDLANMLDLYQPDVVVHFGENPSAPYSMKSPIEAMEVQNNNICGSLSVALAIAAKCPKAHLIKLGSLGMYNPSSWYHMSKVHDAANMKWACKIHGITVTDVQQGPVFGLGGRFDYDECFGTVINRWMVMGAIGHDLLVYGSGEQVRAFIPVQDSIRCFEIEMKNPPQDGSYLSLHQFSEKHKLIDLANIIAEIFGVGIQHIKNPRIEYVKDEEDRTISWLTENGYMPTRVEPVLEEMAKAVRPLVKNVDQSKFLPTINW